MASPCRARCATEAATVVLVVAKPVWVGQRNTLRLTQSRRSSSSKKGAAPPAGRSTLSAVAGAGSAGPPREGPPAMQAEPPAGAAPSVGDLSWEGQATVQLLT
eukprot:1159451-Pelagomonas_calceolata.AAC.2